MQLVLLGDPRAVADIGKRVLLGEAGGRPGQLVEADEGDGARVDDHP